MSEWTKTSGFNIDTVHPLIYEDPHILKGSTFTRQSYFGYSVKFLFGQKDNLDSADKKWYMDYLLMWLIIIFINFYCKRILVGAPRGNSSISTHRNLKEPGRVDRCILGRLGVEDCQQLVIDNIGNSDLNKSLFFFIKIFSPLYS